MMAASCAEPGRNAAPAASTCEINRLAQVPVTFAGRRVAIPAAVNGSKFLFMLDTGADATMLARTTVDRLGLTLDPDRKVEVDALGGKVEMDQTTLSSLSLGDISLSKRAVAVGDLPLSQIDGRPIAGVLGSDLLNRFDVDLDVPGRQLTIYDVRHCTGAFIPWPKPFASVPAVWQFSFSQLTVPVRLNGKPVAAFFDTGAQYSMITRRSAEHRVGVAAQAIEADRIMGFAYGLDYHKLIVRLHTFQTLSIGALQERDIELPVLETREMDNDMLIGMDFIASHRIWFSPTTTQVFVAPARAS